MLTPRSDCVMVTPMDFPNKSESGLLHIPDIAASRTNQGIVKYKGDKVTLVEVGDHVLFGGYTGTLIYVEGEGRLIIIPQEFISCVIHDEPVAVPGLFFQDADNKFFPATHEQAIYLCAKSLERRLAYDANMKRKLLDSREGLRAEDTWR